MSNETNGEFTLVAGGKSYRFKIGVAALIAAQERIGRETGTIPTVNEVVDGVANMRRMLFVRAFLWAGLQKHHPSLTVDDVSDLMDSINLDEARTLILGLAQSTQPDRRDVAAIAEAGPPDPRPTQGKRTGRSNGRARSISRRDGLA